MITEAKLDAARKQHDEAESVINRYYEEQLARFDHRLKASPIFTDDELVYSRETLCPCGHGLAYPKECGPMHYWDCAAILKGIADKSVQHTWQLPFAFYEVKAELDGQTTRGVFKPKTPKAAHAVGGG